MFTVSVKGVLIGVLLIALIVLVVFLIVLISNLTDTIKKANAIIDGGTNAAGAAIAKVDNVNAQFRARRNKMSGLAKTGLGIIQNLASKAKK